MVKSHFSQVYIKMNCILSIFYLLALVAASLADYSVSLSFFFMFISIINVFIIYSQIESLARVPAVKELDINKYIGKWYEVYVNKLVEETIQRGSYCATAQVSHNINSLKYLLTQFFSYVVCTFIQWIDQRL